jgi:hypothetical protein
MGSGTLIRDYVCVKSYYNDSGISVWITVHAQTAFEHFGGPLELLHASACFLLAT